MGGVVLCMALCFAVCGRLRAAEQSAAGKLLDSIDLADCRRAGQFGLYNMRAKLELLLGVHRSRLPGGPKGFHPAVFTWQLYFPYQYELRSVHPFSHEKRMLLRLLAFVHHTASGNYGVGISAQLAWLLVRHLYLRYQLGVGWFENPIPTANDGMTRKGIHFHHVLQLSYALRQQWSISVNLGHVSNGSLFGKTGNVQDNVLVGVSYELR